MTHLLYLDPGSGSMLLQALIAAFVGVGIFFKNVKMFVLSIFGKNKSTVTPAKPVEETTTQHEGN